MGPQLKIVFPWEHEHLINMDTGPSEIRPIFIGITLLGPVSMLIIISKDVL